MAGTAAGLWSKSLHIYQVAAWDEVNSSFPSHKTFSLIKSMLPLLQAVKIYKIAYIWLLWKLHSALTYLPMYLPSTYQFSCIFLGQCSLKLTHLVGGNPTRLLQRNEPALMGHTTATLSLNNVLPWPRKAQAKVLAGKEMYLTMLPFSHFTKQKCYI